MTTAQRHEMTAAPARYAVVGHPVAHSRSPWIHAAFARQTGQAIAYERIDCPPDAFAATVRDFAAAGAAGCNVTLPFKFDAARLAGRLSDRARLAGAVNTLRFDGGAATGGWFGDNTDGAGLVRDIEQGAGVRLAGLRLLLVGAGGSAAGVLGPLLAARPARLVVVTRRVDRARALVDRHAATARDHGVDVDAAALAATGERYDVVVNATASSLQGVASPVDAAVLAPHGALAVDLMYGAAAAPFVAWAESHGAVGRDGLGMLVEQAAEAYALWRGVCPDTAPVLRELRAAIEVGA